MPATATITKIADAKNWKDRAAGWARWRVTAVCVGCGKDKSVVINGTKQDAERLAQNLRCSTCLGE